MKALILFATRYGTTQRCAELLGASLRNMGHEIDIIDLKKIRSIELGPYDAVAVGGSFLMFRMNPLVKRFIDKNLAKLLKMKTGIFMCGADEDWEKEIKKGFPEKLLEKASAKGYFGYEMLWEKMSPMFRAMMQKGLGTKERVSRINRQNIEKFAKDMTRQAGGGKEASLEEGG
jgi:menaquinone-dependent protoporphyrinogen oxidase